MVYTVTFNPSLDYTVEVDDFNLGNVNRTNKESFLPGGKGINVSIVLKNLEIENIALGFVSGFVGKEILKKIEEMGVNSDFIELSKGLSRINVKLKSGIETEINGQGPEITDFDIEKLFKKLDKLQEGDFLVLGGSIPKTLSKDTYEKILKRYSERNIKFIVDATNELLLNVMKYGPFMVKPNNFELGELFNVKINNEDDVIYYARELQKLGGRNIIVSMGEKGAIFLDENGNVMKYPAIGGKGKNTVGAGDSVVAGFIAGYIKYNDFEKAFKYSVAAGSATAISEYLGEKEEILRLYSLIM